MPWLAKDLHHIREGRKGVSGEEEVDGVAFLCIVLEGNTEREEGSEKKRGSREK